MTYNPKDNPFHRTAARIKGNSRVFLAELENSVSGPTLGSIEGDITESRGALQPSAVSLVGLLERTEDNSDLLENLFTYKLDPPRELTPPPPPKIPKPSHAHARKARFSAPRPPPTRATRATEKLEDELLELVNGHAAVVKPKTPATPRRRTRSGPDVSQNMQAPQDGPLIPLRKGQRGVAGLAPYSPLTRRERDLALQVDDIDNRDNFKRFNVGWVLPEGTKRGGRSNVLPLPAGPQVQISRKGKSEWSFYINLSSRVERITCKLQRKRQVSTSLPSHRLPTLWHYQLVVARHLKVL